MGLDDHELWGGGTRSAGQRGVVADSREGGSVTTGVEVGGGQ